MQTVYSSERRGIGICKAKGRQRDGWVTYLRVGSREETNNKRYTLVSPGQGRRRRGILLIGNPRNLLRGSAPAIWGALGSRVNF
jgi:hypothetical protein